MWNHQGAHAPQTTGGATGGGSPSLAGEVECHPRQTVFQIGLRGNQGLQRPTNRHSCFTASMSHDIKILKSNLDISHPDAMRAASDRPLPFKPFSAGSVAIPDFPSWRRTFRHCLASTHLRSTSESNSLHPAHSSLERQALHSWDQSIFTYKNTRNWFPCARNFESFSSSLRRNNSTTESQCQMMGPAIEKQVCNTCCNCDRAEQQLLQLWSRQV